MKLETLASKLLVVLASLLAVAHPLGALAEDIDIFVAGQGGSSTANVLIILDNTSNWSRNDQKWPDEKQGQSELQAIKKVVGTLNAKVNVGLMMINDNGGGNCCTAGYVRYAMRPMTGPNRISLQSLLDNIYNNFGTPLEKSASSADYSSPLFDAFKYYGGYTSPAHATDGVAGTPVSSTAFGDPVFSSPATGSKGYSSYADVAGYTSNAFTNYFPPAASADACGGQNFIIFIGNGWPNDDTAPQQNLKTILEGVGGTSAQIPLPVLTTTTSTANTSLGFSAACYNNNAAGLSSCSTANAGTCGANYDTCTCIATPASTSGCTGSKVKYTVQGGVTTTTVTPTGTTALPAGNKTRYPDEWTRFLYRTDVNAAPGQQNVVTYTIDVFNAKQDADQSALMYSMATAGGGKYFPAKSQAQIETALSSIFAEIQAVNSTFASASLPVSATNRALNVNEVYMGIFRPDPRSRPLWYGNLKRYKIKNFSGDYKLADVNGLDAVNTLNGFITDCATSWWTNDSGQYWKDVSVDPSPAGGCPSPGVTPFDPFSDAPDGPKVEKGGVAEILRQGNIASGSPTWALNRTMYTKNFLTFNTTNSGMAAADVDFVRGQNIDTFGGTVDYTFVDPSGTSRTTSVRPTIHGGVVHSRPLPVNYGGTIGTILYYGSDDGTFRAVNALTGTERWAYIPEEFYPTLPRLRQNSPIIKYAFQGNVVVDPPAQPKNYHFDGSTGLWQKADLSQVWIYPSMRRGGRMVHAFNVTDPANPSLKWKKGCPNLTDDTGCNAGFEGIGQTWSTPNVAKVNVDGTVKATVIMGGGYDNCEDGAAAAACTGAKGSVIYVLDADNGDILASFATAGRVASDVALIDVDYDYIADYAYAADTRGNLYRIAFGPSKTAPLASGAWTSTLIAQTTGGNRKFLQTPALVHGFDKASNKTLVYVVLGSGDREQPLQTQYPYVDDVQNRFYVFMDDVTASSTADLDDASAMEDFTTDPGCGGNRVIPGSGKQGWFMDLPGRGEQAVTSALVVGGLVAFSTNKPGSDAPNVCAPLGIARGYVVNLFNSSGAIAANDVCGGSRSSVFAGGGLPPSPVVANIEVDGKVETIVIGVADLKGNVSSPIQSEIGFTLKPQKRTRMYWRQEGNN